MAGGESRVFVAIEAGNVWLHDVEIAGGFSDSETDDGGGVYALETDLHVADTVIHQCNAHNGAGIWIRGGDLVVTGSTLSGNRGTSYGGGGAIRVSDYYEYGVHTCFIDDCRFLENTSTGEGGAVYCSFSSLWIANSSFHGNRANYGGAVGTSSDASIVNSVFSGNTASGGGALYSQGALTVVNSTLTGNVASSDGGVSVNFAGNLKLCNSIAVGNSPRDIHGAFTRENCLIGVAPQFVRNPSDGGDGWGDDPATEDVDESANDDYGDLRLTSESLAIDLGNVDFVHPASRDLDGNPRVFGESVDAGAYEFQGQAAPGRETPATVVTTSEDRVDAYDGLISLREAIYYAGTTGLHTTVTFDSAVDGATIVLDGAALRIGGSMVIDASALQSLTINAQEESGVFLVQAGRRRRRTSRRVDNYRRLGDSRWRCGRGDCPADD